MNSKTLVDNKPMLNAYPDSIGGSLEIMANFLEKHHWQKIFSSFYILPSLFNSDLDRGFSIIDYSLNQMLASKEALDKIKGLGMNLKLDFILNHASVLSEAFQDIIKNGEKSKYKNFFIDWNSFWEGHGRMTQEGYIQPEPALLQKMFFRKPGLPILMVDFPDGKRAAYWNTFYQKIEMPTINPQEWMQVLDVQYSAAEAISNEIDAFIGSGQEIDKFVLLDQRLGDYQEKVKEYLKSRSYYLGQMDLNIESPLVWEFYGETLKKLSGYGAKIVRLDAFAYAAKSIGAKNFMNEPATWDLLYKLNKLAFEDELELLPEIHASYEEGIYEKIASQGFMTYDFFLPGLVIDALENEMPQYLLDWGREIIKKKMHTVNMLGCHDGIPLLDLKGMLPRERIQNLIDKLVSRGGYVKDLHGQENVYYQVNATYYSALGEDPKKLLMARAIQIFMPGKPQVWYLDLLTGKNDMEGVRRAGPGGHKEINRTNIGSEEAEEKVGESLVRIQLEMLEFRNTCPAFDWDAEVDFNQDEHKFSILWNKQGFRARLEMNLQKKTFSIEGKGPRNHEIYTYTL